MRKDLLLSALATAFLAGGQTKPEVVARAAQLFGRDWEWVHALAERYLEFFSDKPDASPLAVVRFFVADPAFDDTNQRYVGGFGGRNWIDGPGGTRSSPVEMRWGLPRIPTIGALMDWLAVDYGRLEWFADLKGLGYKTDRPKLEHYIYRMLAKPSGSVRLIEAPKKTLKELQRRILWGLLEKVPAHPAVHGFVAGRSIKSFVAPHVGKRVVLRLDLKDFFPGIRAMRVEALFRTFGYPEPVAELLAGICTNATPRRVWKSLREVGGNAIFELQSLHGRPHLPQGAPTSPAVANLCAYRMDCRLTAFARSCGATYTRYADDLAFSGDNDFERQVERFSLHAAAIVLDEGFAVNHRKTRVMRRGVRQHLAGLTTNESVNVKRAEFDQLKAILTNCVRHGLASQNREGHPAFREHLEGRVGFVAMIHPQKGARLRAILERIPKGGQSG